MKKFFAIFLTVVMMFAVCVPAFATKKITDKAPGDQFTKLYTSTEKENGENGAYYTVTIPAELMIYWSTEKTIFSYSIQSQLETGKGLHITAESDTGVRELVDAAGVNKLAYGFSGTDGGPAIDSLAYTTTKEVVNINRAFNIVIGSDAWNAVPVNEYTGNLLFTVEVVDLP